MSSAFSITAAVNPPRAVFVDFPLGHTTGKPGDRTLQTRILREAFRHWEDASTAGEICALDVEWAEDHAWKDRVMRASGQSRGSSETHHDDRVERFDTPQYQSVEDAAVADIDCPSCVFLSSD